MQNGKVTENQGEFVKKGDFVKLTPLSPKGIAFVDGWWGSDIVRIAHIDDVGDMRLVNRETKDSELDIGWSKSAWTTHYKDDIKVEPHVNE